MLGYDKPTLSLSAPTGLAVGLALKEWRYAVNIGDSPRSLSGFIGFPAPCRPAAAGTRLGVSRRSRVLDLHDLCHGQGYGNARRSRRTDGRLRACGGATAWPS